jgi:signal peptidase
MRHRTETKPQPRGRRLLRVGREVGLTLGALAGVLCMVMAVLAVAFEVQPVVFRSGSMSPAIDTGALAISRTVDAADMKVGDVVTVHTSKGIRVTHRIQAMTRNGDQATLILRGDANTVPDEESYVVRSADRVLFDVPKAGHVVNAVTGQAGVFAAGLLVGLLMVTAFSRRPRDDGNSDVEPTTTELVPRWDELVDPNPATPVQPRKDRNGRRSTLIVLVTMLVGGAATAAVISNTSAYFNDSATVTSGTFTMKNTPTPPPVTPDITACVPANGETGYTLTWTWPTAANATNPDSFKVTYTSLSPASPAVGPTTFLGTSRTGVTAAFNDRAGTINLVAVVNGVESTVAATANFAGKNNAKTCTGF